MGLSQALCAGRGPVCGVGNGWCNSEGLCLQNLCWEHYMLLHGVVSSSSPMGLSLSPHGDVIAHDVMSDWGFPSLLKSMIDSPVVQAGLKEPPGVIKCNKDTKVSLPPGPVLKQ